MPSACKSTEYTLPFSKLGMCAWWLEQRKARNKPSITNMQTCRAVSAILGFIFKGLCLWSFVARNIHFFSLCSSHSVYSFAWTLSHDTGIFIILGPLLKPRVYFYSFSECFLRGVLQGHNHHLPYIKWHQLVSETSWEELMTSSILHSFISNISTTRITPPS